MGEDPTAIREGIEATRQSMSETLGALAYKTDVPERVKEQVQATATAVAGAASDLSARLTEAATTAGVQVQATAADVATAASGVATRLTEAATTAGVQVQATAADVAGDLTAKAGEFSAKASELSAKAGELLQSPEAEAVASRLKSIDPRITAGIGIFALGYIVGLTVGRR